jgi:hypothetical protein
MKFLSFITFWACFFLFSCQNQPNSGAKNKKVEHYISSDHSSLSFLTDWHDNPDLRPNLARKDWLGVYEGTMKMYALNSPDTPHWVKLVVEIDTTPVVNQWVWRVGYTSSVYGNVVKDYKLVQPDSFKGTPQYWTDENNGILLQNSYFDNTFYNFYTVNGSYYNCVFKRFGDLLFYDIYTAAPKVVSEYNQEGFEVKSMPVFSSQSAVLKKVK